MSCSCCWLLDACVLCEGRTDRRGCQGVATMTAAVGNNWLVLVFFTAALASTLILADRSSEFVKGKSKYTEMPVHKIVLLQ